MSNCITPFALKDAPALIEWLLPVQKLSAESYKEQEARQSKTLTALGSYWKGRKPLILNKACILGCLLPATDDRARDLEIFEKLMAMDDESFVARWKRRPRPKEILAALSIARIADYFTVEPEGVLPESAGVSQAEIEAAETGTVGREGKYGEAYLIHQVDGVAYKTKISTLRGDYQKSDGTIGNRVRLSAILILALNWYRAAIVAQGH